MKRKKYLHVPGRAALAGGLTLAMCCFWPTGGSVARAENTDTETSDWQWMQGTDGEPYTLAARAADHASVRTSAVGGQRREYLSGCRNHR